MNNSSPFPHIFLKLEREADRRRRPFPRDDTPTTAANKNNRSAHASTLRHSVETLNNEWSETAEIRRQQGSPELPEAISLFLQVDPDTDLIDNLRSLGIEVIGELEDGYIIGASADISLATLKDKIERFASAGQNNIAALWEIREGKAWRYEHILSPTLLEEWPNIRDNDQFVIEVGIACLGTIHIPEHPRKRRDTFSTEERYMRAVRLWKEKHDRAYEQWDELSWERLSLLESFVSSYNGEMLSSIMNEAWGEGDQPPDSFTCRIRINGQGLRDFVLNFPFVFDIAEVDDIEAIRGEVAAAATEESDFEIVPPEVHAPRVCVIDSGIQERHSLLNDAVEHSESRSWINTSTDVADYYPGGHGTRTAGAVLYPQGITNYRRHVLNAWIQNARILNEEIKMPEDLFPPQVLVELTEHFHGGLAKTRIFNHSINAVAPCRLIHMSAWAEAIDRLTWKNDVLFVLSAGNIPVRGSITNPGIVDRILSGQGYPEYLYLPSSRIANPAQSLQAITVGSVGLDDLTGEKNSFAGVSQPSSFSRTGPGIWSVIKPEVVEYGGDFAYDSGNPPNLSITTEVAPQLVRSTLHGGPAYGNDRVGTSFAAPKVSHILAAIQTTLSNEPALLYRGLLIQSARWPDWTSSYPDKNQVIRSIGYGIPDVERATTNTEYRITLITQGEMIIRARQVHIYEVIIPEELRHPSDAFEILVEVTLSYKAQPRRTRRTRSRYLSTWLEWQTSKCNESREAFLNRMIQVAENDRVIENEPNSEQGSSNGAIQWTIRERSDWGQVRGFSRNNGTVQKDWATLQSHEFAEGFYLAVIGHEGWNTEIDASVPYSLVVSFEAVNQDIEIYSRIAVVNQVEIETQVEVNV